MKIIARNDGLHEVFLNQDMIQKLMDLPETGMGYQLVRVALTNGLILKDIMVYNSEVALLPEGIEIKDVDKIWM